MITNNNDTALVQRMLTDGAVKDLITFVVRNNFIEVRQNLYKLGYSVQSINNEEAAINAVNQIYKAGFSIREILNVKYNPNAPNETGQMFMAANNFTGSKNKVDWTALGTGILGVVLGYFGGQYADVATNSNNAPPPTPEQTGDLSGGKTDWLKIGSLSVAGLAALGLIYALAFKKKRIAIVSAGVLIVSGGVSIYTFTKSK